jgi:hypothetical protein
MKSSVFWDFFKNFFGSQNTINIPKETGGPKITADSRVDLPIMRKDGRGNHRQIRQWSAFKPTIDN